MLSLLGEHSRTPGAHDAITLSDIAFSSVAIDSDLVKRLERGYRSQCDGDWEHGEGVEIGTLDNPGSP